jgi:hypothetical protein
VGHLRHVQIPCHRTWLVPVLNETTQIQSQKKISKIQSTVTTNLDELAAKAAGVKDDGSLHRKKQERGFVS